MIYREFSLNSAHFKNLPMETEITDFETNDSQDKMPTFLKVLCILTFVGSGIGLLGGIANLAFLTPDVLYKTMIENSKQLDSVLPPYNEFVQWSNYSNIVSFLMSILGLVAGVLMWKRKKVGFYIYVFSWVGSVVMTAVAFDHISDSFTEKLFPVVIAINVLLMAAFVIMYGINLKHMNK